jgi:hypothetical protein
MWVILLVILGLFAGLLFLGHLVVKAVWCRIAEKPARQMLEQVCVTCGYPAYGWSGDMCPECGTDIKSKPFRTIGLAWHLWLGFLLVAAVASVQMLVVNAAVPGVNVDVQTGSDGSYGQNPHYVAFTISEYRAQWVYPYGWPDPIEHQSIFHFSLTVADSPDSPAVSKGTFVSPYKADSAGNTLREAVRETFMNSPSNLFGEIQYRVAAHPDKYPSGLTGDLPEWKLMDIRAGGAWHRRMSGWANFYWTVRLLMYGVIVLQAGAHLIYRTNRQNIFELALTKMEAGPSSNLSTSYSSGSSSSKS